MNNMDVYLGQESLESANKWISTQLSIGTRVSTMSQSLLTMDIGTLIITKWDGGHIDEYSNDEKIDVFTQYINENFKDHSKRSCVSSDIKRLMEENYYGVDIDEYGDYLTELMGSRGYQRVNHHITNIMACFKPYMMEKHPDELHNMTIKELELALIAFVKEHLQECNDVKK